MKKNYVVPEKFHGVALMDFLKGQGYSSSMLKKMVHQGGVSVNGGFHRNIDPVSVGDMVEIDFPDIAAVLPPNGSLNVPVLLETEDFVIFDKPDDMLVHAATKDFDDALGNYFSYLYPNIPFRPLGRLDRHTTGLCFVAKNRLCAVTMNKTIEKEYLAIAEGEIEEEKGTIDAPLLRVEGSIIQRKVDCKGKYAVTHYETLKKHKNYTFLKVRLETGRTHQIRAHFSHIGHPLTGDILYGGHKKIIERQALHCSTMAFSYNDKYFFVTSSLPDDMKFALSNLQNY